MAYARQIVARTAVDEWRRPWRRELVTSPELLDVAADRRRADPTDRLAVLAALARLPGRQRQVVVLRYWSGLSVAETAADLRISEGAVKSHTFRAMSRLHDLLSLPDQYEEHV